MTSSNGPNAANHKRSDVLIAGGGFVGLSLALALARLAPAGFRVTLVDRRPQDAEVGDARASALTAASRNLLDTLGVWQKIESVAQPIEQIEITDSPLDAKGPRPSLIGFDNAMEAGVGRNAGSSAYVVENGPLLRALAEAVAAEPAISVLAPDAVDGFSCTPFAIACTLESGETIDASLLVAADGRRSKLREQAGIKTVAWDYDQRGIVTTVAHERPHGGKAIQHFLPAGPFAMLPLTGNRTSIVWSEDKEEAARVMALDEAGFLAELEKRFGNQLGSLTLAGPRQDFPLSLHLARSFTAPRMVLVGDAAHGVHPLAGQGLNIGLRDVAALTEVLVDGARLGLDAGDAAQLEAYARWRRFDSALSALAMDMMNRLFSNDSTIARAFRDFGLSVVERLPGVKRLLVQEAAGGTGRPPKLLQGKPL
ncbi:2-octaprenylphenol hydroxylase [Methyloligella halotolerans]|uniref:2-octaprenylphenol hydroxylase n=1 Tax=Methyloligella halotolerans TaxID=1177755 RepID=A0A1E2S0Q9_9HYPH|nr:FAD-dependent oxidoreductase [Methyloligella halotolerans]ODA68002.1 2-octaprenylphenol hydroxylase [Methyloligella halotolerans]